VLGFSPTVAGIGLSSFCTVPKRSGLKKCMIPPLYVPLLHDECFCGMKTMIPLHKNESMNNAKKRIVDKKTGTVSEESVPNG
jgi:hypothetical protein